MKAKTQLSTLTLTEYARSMLLASSKPLKERIKDFFMDEDFKQAWGLMQGEKE